MNDEKITTILEHSPALGVTQRSQAWAVRSAYYWGEAYDGLPEHHDPAHAELPLRQRQPTVIARLGAAHVDQVTALLFGRGRQPTYRVAGLEGPDGEVVELTEPERAALDERVASIIRRAQLPGHLSELGRIGLVQGTVALAGYQTESGRAWAEVLHLHDAVPVFASADRETADALELREGDLTELDVYWWERTEDPGGKTTKALRRRRWTLTDVLEYEPLEDVTLGDVALDGLDWELDEAASVTHDLGLVPVSWVRNRRVAGSPWGAPLITEVEHLIEDEVNYTITQRGRGVRYNCEPQLYVKDGANATGPDGEPLGRGSNRTINVESYGGDMPGVELGILEMTGLGLEQAAAYVDSLGHLLRQVTRVVDHDPQRAAGALSGVALQRMMAPTVALVDDLRGEYGEGLSRWLELMLMIDGAELEDDTFEGEDVEVDEDLVDDDASEEDVPVAITAQDSAVPEELRRVIVEVTWPEIIEPTAADFAAVVAPVIDLYESGIIDAEAALTRLASHLSIDDVAAYLEAQAERVVDSSPTTSFADGDEEGDDDQASA